MRFCADADVARNITKIIDRVSSGKVSGNDNFPMEVLRENKENFWLHL